MEDCKFLATPLDANSKLLKDMSPLTDEDINAMMGVPYQSVVGSLVYAMIGTRADIAFVVGVVSQYMANPGPQHWVVVKRILCYLKGTIDYVLRYGGSYKLLDTVMLTMRVTLTVKNLQHGTSFS